MRWPTAITKAREARGLTQREVGDRMKLSYVALGNRERGVTTITEEWLFTFLGAIGMNREEFFTLVERVPVHSLAPSEDIPLYPSLASAGRRAFVPEDTGEEWTTTLDRGSATFHPRAFAVTIEGDSMEPRVLHGDVAICEPVDDEDGIGVLTDGRMVLVWGGVGEVADIQNNEPRRARAMIMPTGGMIGLWAWVSGGAELRKANPKYSAIQIPAQHDGTLRVAVVVEIRRRV